MDKKILAWDVGIKNLAYCIIHRKGDDFKILSWGLVDLVDDRQKCQFTLRSGNCCSSIAKFSVYHKDKQILFPELGENAFVCQKHKEKMIPQIIEIAKQKKVKSGICILCNKKSTHCLSDTNYHWCQEHFNKKGQAFVKKINTKRVANAGCMKQPLQALAEKLYSKLDKESQLFKVDEVLIENQPTFINPTMKTLSAILYSYFVLRAVTDKKQTKSTITDVRFVSPSSKLNVNKADTDRILNENKQNAYKMTKKLSVEYCLALINNSDKAIINKYKKKDDLADSFLHAFKYIFNPVPLKYFKKLEDIGFELSKKKPTKRKVKVVGNTEKGEISLEKKQKKSKKAIP